MKTYQGKVEGGVFNNLRHLLAQFRELDGKRVVVTVAVSKPKWTGQQRKYLFSTVYPFVASVTGLEEDDAAAVCLQRFWSKFVGAIRVPRSHREMSIEDFDKYLMNIDIWMVENYGVNIPEAKK